jgi:hypothetical protein
MGKKKEGDLRLLKDGVVFGPTDRAGLDQLLSAGRITLDDRVSVRNADWISIADFLAIPKTSARAATPQAAPASQPATSPETAASPAAATSPAAASTPQASAPPAAAEKKTGDLRVINGGRMIGSLTRKDVQQLTATGHLADDDLVCALDGPWMRVADFLSTRAPVQPSRSRPPAAGTATGAEPRQGDSPAAEASHPVSPSGETQEPQPMVVMAGRVEVVQSRESLRHLVEPMAVVGKTSGWTYKLSEAAPGKKKKPDLEDQWYVRIRAMCSAPLGKRHLKALYQSREITSESLARHPKWDENDWRPIHSIPELAELSRP